MGLIRVLLALSVVFAHSPWHDGFVLVGGRNAVQMFYAISGFLIAHVLRTNPNYQEPARFYANRALRIYPIYFAVALLSLAPALLTHSGFRDFYRLAGAPASWLVAISNLTIFGQDWAMFGSTQNGSLQFTPDFTQAQSPLYPGLLVPQAWTLGVELTFYLIAPFLLRRNVWIIAALLLSIATRGYLFYIGIGDRDPWSYRFFPAELSLFLLGALANRWGLPVYERALRSRPTAFRRASAAAVVGMTSLIVVYFILPAPEALKTTILLAVFVPLLPLVFMFRATGRWDSELGELSYPIYICHILAIMAVGIVSRALQWHLGEGIVTAVNIIVSIAFAATLNLLLERPVERLRGRIRRGALMR